MSFICAVKISVLGKIEYWWGEGLEGWGQVGKSSCRWSFRKLCSCTFKSQTRRASKSLKAARRLCVTFAPFPNQTTTTHQTQLQYCNKSPPVGLSPIWSVFALDFPALFPLFVSASSQWLSLISIMIRFLECVFPPAILARSMGNTHGCDGVVYLHWVATTREAVFNVRVFPGYWRIPCCLSQYNCWEEVFQTLRLASFSALSSIYGLSKTKISFSELYASYNIRIVNSGFLVWVEVLFTTLESNSNAASQRSYACFLHQIELAIKDGCLNKQPLLPESKQ